MPENLGLPGHMLAYRHVHGLGFVAGPTNNRIFVVRTSLTGMTDDAGNHTTHRRQRVGGRQVLLVGLLHSD